MAVFFLCLFGPIVLGWCDILGLGYRTVRLLKSVLEPMAAEKGAHLLDR